MHRALLRQIADRLARRSKSAQVQHSDINVRSASDARKARSTICEPNVNLVFFQWNTFCWSVADGDDEYLMGTDKISARTSTHFL